MYIKQVIIQGFKSYRDQTVIEPFDARHNVVVGRNGSGKSNFFYAIQFVLSDEFCHLRPDQRQALLHEGTGTPVVSAYVEIIFDNSDGRLPLDKDEVFLRRVIGSKKDQYYLNKKVVPKSDIMNLFESAGFSRSNPYYIVKQGKINQMAIAPDSQRLKLLREVAGTRVFDERCEESKIILRECEIKREKIDEILCTIEERLSSLEEEKEELKAYQKWDRVRRALEYTIHERELSDTRLKLQEMENQRNNSGKEQEKLKGALQDAQEKAKAAAKELKDCKHKVASAKEERDAYNAENQQLLRERARLELVIRDLSDEVLGDNKSKERAEQELARLHQTIQQKETDLSLIKPQYEEMRAREDSCTRNLALKEQKRKELYAKQGRGSQFTSKEQRDQWIQKELRSLTRQIRDKKEQIDRLSEDLSRDSDKRLQLEQRIEEMNTEIERYRISIDDHAKSYYELKKQKEQLQSERNELWRKENSLQQNLSAQKEELCRADQSLRSMVGKPTLNGRDSVSKVLALFQQRGGMWQELAASYFGPVIELFECDRSIYTAVEVTAGNRLFHHVVESDKVGTHILKEMNKQKLAGEVTFMPLNRLAVWDIDYPQSKDAIPMVSKMNYETRYDKALRYIFGRTLICRNLEVATQMAKTSRLDCVTMDGDQVMSKGSLTGGYFNTSRSRLEIQKSRRELSAKISQSDAEFSTLKANLFSLENDISKAVSDLQRTETKSGKAKDVLEKVRADSRLMKEELLGLERARQPRERALSQLRASLEAMEGTRQGLENELQQELLPTLSCDDQREVSQLNDQIRQLSRDNKSAFSQRMRLEAEKNKLENLLANNLTRRREELLQALQEVSAEDRRRQLEHSQGEMGRCKQKLEHVSAALGDCEKRVTAQQRKQRDSQRELERWRTAEREALDRLADDSRDLDKMAVKQNLLQSKVDECARKITELDSLPGDTLRQHANVSTKQLFRRLEKANAELKKYSHVNKKALDQFVQCTEQKERLIERKEEQSKGLEKIMELIRVLDRQKNEAIRHTFRQVSNNFTEVFARLVPHGSAQLLMKSMTAGTSEESLISDKELNNTNVDMFTGITIRISFSGRKTEMREMNQLSGGQKSLVALALIFSIQKCDPAPFYLFDEIDQALDASHRKAVADMLHELSEHAQFVTTTFRPELLEHANKFYGVKFRNKVSHVVCVTREEAYDFVEDDTTHD